MKIKFCGAAEIVTGSCYYIEFEKNKILVDCGMFQGPKEITKLNYEPFLFDPKKITHVFLTHAHIDHSGLIPKLVAQGFKGKIITTTATADLCKIMLEDSAFIQEKDTEHENERRKKKKLPRREPIYTMNDAKNSFKLFKGIKYNKRIVINDTLEVEYKDAGHILGSAIIEMYIREKGRTKKFVFSGDLGQWDVPIVEDPELISEADYVLIESTYGNRLHKEKGIRDQLLMKVANKVFKRGGKMIIPSFAVERTQELLYAFNKLIKEDKFPNEKIFLDSPLAIKATKIFQTKREYFDMEAYHEYKSCFSFKNLQFTTKTEESKQLNFYKKPCVIIAGSGMCTGGRIRHHIRNNVENPKNAILFVGYQAEGTLGRVMIEGAKTIRMMGREIEVKAEIEKIGSFSAHADSNELIRWINGFTKKPKKIFIVHGEQESQKALKEKITNIGLKSYIPKLGETIKI